MTGRTFEIHHAQVSHQVFPIDDLPVVEPQTDSLLEERPLQSQEMDIVKAVGVGGHRRALRQHVEAREESEPGVERVP